MVFNYLEFIKKYRIEDMNFRNLRSIIVISFYMALNAFIIVTSLGIKPGEILVPSKNKSMAPAYTEIENLDYFHLKDSAPQMSLSAVKMKSLGDEVTDFTEPKGIYRLEGKDKTLNYRANFGSYKKTKNLLSMKGDVEISSTDGKYRANKMDYYFQKDLVKGVGDIEFEGEDLKSFDQLKITADTMRASPGQKISKFTGKVKGQILRKKKYEGRMDFKSQEFTLDENKSLAHLSGDVEMKRGTYLITSGKADLYLENFNKSLKYFVLNDDVQMTSKIQTPEGIQERKAFSARLEGFGAEQKMVLSGAPRVEMGKDTIKGYRITIRENIEMIEVDDAMSDVQLKKLPKVKE